jgi:hypothetical protein
MKRGQRKTLWGGQRLRIFQNSKELTNDQLLFIETYENRKLYNDFRNKILERDRDLNPGPQGYEDFLRK